MKVFKGVNEDLCCTRGEGTYQYKIGRTERTERSKTRSKGFHASEYVLEALYWYQLDGHNKVLVCEAAGSIDEDGEDIVTCTEITPIRELTRLDIITEAMAYMIDHPGRKWERSGKNLCVSKDEADVGENGIAIARGKEPSVKGGMGAYLGLIREDKVITEVKMFRVDGKKYLPDKLYSLGGEA